MYVRQEASAREKRSCFALFPWWHFCCMNVLLAEVNAALLGIRLKNRLPYLGNTLRMSACLRQSYQTDRETPEALYYRKVCPVSICGCVSGIEFSWPWATESGCGEHPRKIWSFTSMCSRGFRVQDGFVFVMFYLKKYCCHHLVSRMEGRLLERARPLSYVLSLRSLLLWSYPKSIFRLIKSLHLTLLRVSFPTQVLPIILLEM